MTRALASLLITLFLLVVAAAASAAAPPVAPTARPAAAAPQAAGKASTIAPATATDSPAVPIWSRAGILVEAGGRALYTYTQDEPGKSRCDLPCEALWPPHFAEPGAKPHGPFTLATSFTGRPMWAWQGKPLYRWISDRKRGAAGGDGVADVWFLVKVPAALAAQVPAYRPMPTPRPGFPARPTSTVSSPRTSE